MSGLQALKIRIKSSKSTQKITKAMKMVAASKLRRARMQAEASKEYALKMHEVISDLAHNIDLPSWNLLTGTGDDKVHLVIVAVSDRGLCGGFNSSVVKTAKRHIQELLKANKTVKIVCYGKKAFDQLKAEYLEYIVHRIDGISKGKLSYFRAEELFEFIEIKFKEKAFDVCSIFYNHFASTISQVPTRLQLIPFVSYEHEYEGSKYNFDFEPQAERILEEIVPLNIKTQIYQVLLENAASEQGARVTAMDNATRNAQDMIGRLTLEYNRKRQASITKELIEIISGAEAL
jgi:F-type H+-transporting ATPase subunit gamma